VLRDGGWAVSATRADLSRFALPHYDAAQRQLLSLAVSKIGMPYVWGGTTDTTADGLPHGGYDCSGFVWRVYKVSGFAWGARIGGRTAAQQAAEIPRSQRIRRRAVRGGDLLFFGSAWFDSPATEQNVTHEGIALGQGWVIHSSDQGVYVLPLSHGWLHDSFAWARRVL
jgi:cell wall-associated NlpC family hydrolase